ncbi:MAG: alpha/beta hydrolase-fold protein [Brevinematia bacterium]
MHRILAISILFLYLSNIGFGLSFRTNGNFVIIQEFESKILKNKRTIRIFLPPDYFSSTNYYTVLYAHDGQNIYYDERNKARWDIDKTVELLTKEGKIKDVVIVGIDHMGTDRIKEYTPFPLEAYGGGLGEVYCKFLVEEIKPFIEANFRVETNREFVGTFGSSLGGLISLYLGMWYPEVFGIIGCISPSFWWGLERTKSNVIQNLNRLSKLKIYIDIGYSEGREQESENNIVYTTREICNILLTKMDYPKLLYFEDKKGIHSEISWKERISNFLIFALTKKPLSEEITSIQLDIHPNEWGTGDRGFLFVNATTKDGITRTIYQITPSLEKMNYLGNGYIEASESGKAKITVSIGKLSSSKEVNIETLSRKFGVVNINVFATSTNVGFLVEEEDGKKTNYIIKLNTPDNVEEQKLFFTSITNIRGKSYKGKFVLDGKTREETKHIILNKRFKEYKFKF